ncbi:dynamin family protein [Actinotalea sp.]|uniref:dynamin family protein n=1 Tax=Actinotalea sp. TaxID=1872145 RepID=UPI00356929EB
MTSAPNAAHRGWGLVAAADADRPVAKASLLDAVADLRRDVAATEFPLELPGVDTARSQRGALLDQLDDHLLPRLRELSAPGLVVVAGSTGAGKSTIVNSLLREEVSPAGVLRPTTRKPVLVHHPADGELLSAHPLLADVEVLAREAVPRGLALIDAPDLDSLLATNRTSAHRLLEAADLWVFVTTAARYGDALPWQVLDRAAQRTTSMAMVLNRVPAEALVAVRGDLLARLRERGMGSVPLFLVPDAGPHEGMLEAKTVAPILRWLSVLAGADRAQAVIARTQRGSLAALQPWVEELADAVQAQVDARTDLEQRIEAALETAVDRARRAVVTGAVADGPVRNGWAAKAGAKGPLGGSWRSRRASGARTEALNAVADDLLHAATVTLSAARRGGELAALQALDDETPGARALAAAARAVDVPAEPAPDRAAHDWLRRVEERVAQEPSLGRLSRQVGGRGAATVVAAAGVGVGAARIVAQEAIGDLARGITVASAGDLEEAVAVQVRAGARAVESLLSSVHLADDAAAVLRLRRAVLKGWT